MAQNTDDCSICGRALIPEASSDDVRPDERLVCSNPDCPGRWTATQPGGEGGVRTSYDVPGLAGDADG
jgi:hypothetical protein